MNTLDDLIGDGAGSLSGKRVLVRSDLNVPLEGGRITDDGRIRASVPTIAKLTEAGARVLVTAHLGRPAGTPQEKYSLAPVAERLGELLGAPVAFATDLVGDSARETAAGLADGQVAVLENVRFDPRETSKDAGERTELATELAGLADAFVSDGFGVVHREQASVYEIAERLPAYAGGLVLAELDVLRTLTGDPERPYVVVLGGSKVSDKLAVIERLLPTVDHLLVGGGMCFTFLAAQGFGVGDSLLEADMIDTCKRLLGEAGDKILLPADVVIADDLSAEADTETVLAANIRPAWKGLDIGPITVERYADVLSNARTVFWNGPMGVFELAPFAAGTEGVARAIIGATSAGAFSVVGGGDSAAAVRQLGIGAEDGSGFSHISTGGGASLEFLEGKELPGVAVLDR